MGASSTRESWGLKSTVNGIAERFATACDSARGPREVRDLADEFALDVIRALRNATLAEIAETVNVLEAKRKARAEERAAARKNAPKSQRRPAMRGTTRVVSGPSASVAPDAGPSSRRDPFDITKPGELLDTEVTPRREDERAPVSVRQVRSGDAMPAILSVPSKPAPTPAAPPAPPPPPAIALREGEQLLRVGGSGAVIRRVRSA
jgi:hypothetical protein